MKAVVLLVIVSVCFGQQTAKRKCWEYSALAKANTNRHSPACRTHTDRRSGVEVKPNEFPATVSLGFERPKDDDILYTCDGVLISEDTVLSTCDCVRGDDKHSGTPKWVRLGSGETQYEEVEIKEAFCHPEFSYEDDKPANANLGLVRLDERLNSSYIPACLDTRGVYEEDHLVVTGQIMRTDKQLYPGLNRIKAKLSVRPARECAEAHPSYNISADHELCTKDLSNGPGDCVFGFPYVFRRSCVHTIVGILSVCQQCSSDSPASHSPTVYSLISSHLPWIESNTWPATNARPHVCW